MNILMDANNTCKFVKKYNIKLLLIDNYSINLKMGKDSFSLLQNYSYK